ncbi:MAG: T9SS type A sorting domain-containing protein [Bacteroidetes bacterium]|nr:T9SS type A sorting domain-containing protein [Bacteroidota bacterium]
MTRTIYLFVCLLILNNHCKAQGVSNIWRMGYQSVGGGQYGNTRFDFDSGILIKVHDSIEMGFLTTSVTMCDTSGALLFLSNGFDLADSTGKIMLNGDDISPSSYKSIFPIGMGLDIPQANLALQVPGSDSLYYLFHSTRDGPQYKYTYELDYSIIDMTGNSGLGEVISKNIPLIMDTINWGKITACRHGNGRDWWVTCLQMNSNLIYKFMVTPYGISAPDTQSIGWLKTRGLGECKFSPDGTKFAFACADYTKPGNAEIMDFDRCTGMFSNPYHFVLTQANGFGGGCSFSPNSQLLYISTVDSVYQYDLNAANIEQSKIIIAAWDSFYSPSPPFATVFYTCQIAPDGKIYISTGNSTFHLHVVNNPDVLGIGCDLVQHAIALNHFYANSLPNHPNYFLGANGLCNNLNYESLESWKVKKVTVFNNPTHDKFTLWFPVDKDVGGLEIYDVNGECIRREYVAQWSQYKTVDIGALSAGVYFCKMQWPSGEGSVKVVRLE